MIDLDTWQEIAVTARNSPLRTFMTALGVFWGMFMLLVMLGFGTGLEVGVSRNMGGVATNAVFVWGQRTSLPYQGMQPGRPLGFDNSDVEALLERVDGIEHLAPRNQLGGWSRGNNVSRGTEVGNYSVMGDTPAVHAIQPTDLVRGRFMNPFDVEQFRKIAVIGDQVAAELFNDDEDPIGQAITIRGVYFQVVGVFKPRDAGDFGDRLSGSIYVPFSTFQRVFNYGDRVGWLSFTAKPEIEAAALERDVKVVLAERHDVHPEDLQAFGSFNAGEEFSKIVDLFAAIRAFTWMVGVATLLSGVVGVMNIMLVVVRERTPEIGIRRALGATPASVVGHVVLESVVLTAVAGYAGVVVAVAVLEMVAFVVGPANDVMGQPGVDFGTAAWAAVVLVISGVFAGLLPARRAVAIKPVEALRA